MGTAARLILYFMIVWAPLPLGSNRPIAWVVNGVAACTGFALLLASEATRGRKGAWDPGPSTPALAALTIAVLWMVIQTVPGMPAALQHPVWARVAGDVSGGANTISISPGATWGAIAQVVPVVLAALIAVRLGADDKRSLMPVKLVAATSIAVGAYGLLARDAGFNSVFFDTASDSQVLTGTFASRNAAAAYFAVGLAACTSLFLSPFERRSSRRSMKESRVKQEGTAAPFPLSSGVWLVGALVLTAAILNTASRGGAIGALIATVAIALVLALKASLPGHLVAAGIVVATLALGLFAGISGDALFERLASGIDSSERLRGYQDTLDMIVSRPLLGQGAGTFVDAYPLFHERGTSAGTWNAAHNTYLQATAELGLPIFLLLMLTAAGVVVYLVRAVARRSAAMPAAAAALGAVSATAFQSAVDFTFQFQAVSLTVLVLVATGFGEAMARQRKPPVSIRHGRIRAEEEVGERQSEMAAAGRARSVAMLLGQHASGADITETIYVSLPPAKRPAQALALAYAGPAAPDEVMAPVPQAPIAWPAGPRPGPGPASRIYVFGDLHGRLDLLLTLKAAIRRDQEKNPAEPALVVGLGDYIDRGPGSRRVIDELIAGFDCPSVMLRGNHEQMLLDFLDDPLRNGQLWFHYGAVETLLSYGLDLKDVGGSRTNLVAVRNRFARLLPPSHATFLQRLKLSHQHGEFFFAHAGARPGTPLGEQNARDLLWIRSGFADRDANFEKIVVHGHTPVDEPYLGRFRINLDTGAYATNRLTCLVIEPAGHRLLEL